MKRRATLKDIADLAGVSLSTASRALRMPELFTQETVDRVCTAAAKLSYVPNAAASTLSRRRSNTIGIIMPSPEYSAFAGNLLAIQRVCSERNYSFKLEFTDFSPEKELIALKHFEEHRVEGAILVGIDSEHIPLLKQLDHNGIRNILLWEKSDDICNYIAIDNEHATLQGLEYLYKLGHRRIAYMLGPYACTLRNREKQNAYIKFIREHDLELDADLITSHPPTFFMGKEAMRRFLKLDNPPTAAFCVNDNLAIGAVRAVREAGLRVPEDISICGFDDIAISAYLDTPLTSIRTPIFEMGEIAASMLIESIENDSDLDVQYLLDTQLVVRGTCAAVSQENQR